MDAHLDFEGVVNRARDKLIGLGEQVVEQANEDALVVRRELAHVEVSQRTQQHLHRNLSLKRVCMDQTPSKVRIHSL